MRTLLLTTALSLVLTSAGATDETGPGLNKTPGPGRQPARTPPLFVRPGQSTSGRGATTTGTSRDKHKRQPQKKSSRPPTAPRCTRPALPDAGRLPFGPGEELDYIIHLAGVYVGRIHLKVAERETRGDQLSYPIHARATTNSFFRNLAKADSHMTTFVAPDGVVPIASFSRSEMPGGVRAEEVTFQPGTHRAEGSLKYGDRTWQTRKAAVLPLQDVLSIVYHVRGRVLEPGTTHCTEILYGRHLFIVEARVGTPQYLATVAGALPSIPLSAVARVDTVPGYRREFTVWLSTDDDRLPLRLTTPSSVGEIEVQIDGFKRGRRLVRSS